MSCLLSCLSAILHSNVYVLLPPLLLFASSYHTCLLPSFISCSANERVGEYASEAVMPCYWQLWWYLFHYHCVQSVIIRTLNMSLTLWLTFLSCLQHVFRLLLPLALLLLHCRLSLSKSFISPSNLRIIPVTIFSTEKPIQFQLIYYIGVLDLTIYLAVLLHHNIGLRRYMSV
jgi:hypothetical protein